MSYRGETRIRGRHDKHPRPVRIRAVKPLRKFMVHLTFTDNSERDVDLEQYLHGPIFESLRKNPRLFRALRVDPESQTISWPNGADIDPDVLYHNRTPAWMEEEAQKDGTPSKRRPMANRATLVK
jgi:hypothetical protein